MESKMRVHHVLPVNKQLDHAYWIGVPGRAFAWACRDEYPAPFFRRTFEWDGIAPARLSVAAAGYIEIHLNGEKVGDHVLDPTPTNFDKHLYLLEFNVEHLLRKGKNAVGVILGNSTYNCSTGGPWMLDEIPWRDYPKFILQLNVDGTPAVYSDPDWKFFGDGPIRMDEVKNGEFYDARLEQVGWDRPDFDDSRWSRAGVVHAPGGEIMRHTHEPCRVFRTFPMRRIGKNVYDSGQNLSGWVQIEVEGDPGSTVQIRYAEKIDEHGRIDQLGISRFVTTGLFQTDRYTLKGGGQEIWHPRFAYHGFRYAEITIEGNAEISAVEAQALGTDFRQIGSIVSSDEVLNALHRNACWSYRSNFTGIPTDCPQREKQGWTGDALLGVELGLYNFDAADAYADWMVTVEDTQRPNGQLAAKAPLSSGGYNWAFGPAWDSAFLMIPATVYAFTGRTDLIRRHYFAMQKYLDFCIDMSPGMIASWGLGDYLNPEPEERIVSSALISTAFFYADAKLMARFAGLLGKSGDVPYYEALGKEIFQAFQKKFANPDGSFGNGSQTALAASVFFGLAPSPQLTASLLDELVKKEEHLAHFGIQGAKFVPRVLAEYGFIDTAYELIVQKRFPGWACQLQQGATTSWEQWSGTGSRNHVVFADIGAWFYRYPGGFRVSMEKPGYSAMTIRPCFPAALSSFEAEYRGYSCRWKQNDKTTALQIGVPEHSQAFVDVPNRKETLLLTSGVHEIEIVK